MVLESIGQGNIKDLILPPKIEEEHSEMFNPIAEMSEEDWDILTNRINELRRPSNEHAWQDFLVLSTIAKTFNQVRFEELNVSNDDLVRIQKIREVGHIRVDDYQHEYLMKILFNHQDSSGYFVQEHYKDREDLLVSDLSVPIMGKSFIEFALNETMGVKLLEPELWDNLSIDKDSFFQKSYQTVSSYDPADSGSSAMSDLLFVRQILAMRALFPERPVVVTDEQWKSLHTTWKSYILHVSGYNFSLQPLTIELAWNIALLNADKVDYTPHGIFLREDKKFLQEDVPEPKEREF